MLQAKDACYVLVRTSTEGFDLYQRLVDAGVPARVAPAPHGMQACCALRCFLTPKWSMRRGGLSRPRRTLLSASCASRAPSTLRATRIASVWRPCDLRR